MEDERQRNGEDDEGQRQRRFVEYRLQHIHLWSLLRRVRNDHPSTDLASSGRGASDLLVAENPGRDVYRTTVGSFSLGDGIGGCAARVPGWTVSLAGGLTMMKIHKVEPVLICA